MSEKTEVAVCRGCGKELEGSPYHRGGEARDPITREKAKRNYYGGWVCSRSCDQSASRRLENSMPGAVPGYKASLSSAARQKIRDNWDV